jgi:hypothetical protein
MYGHVESPGEKKRVREMFKEGRYCGTYRTKNIDKIKIV